MGWSECSTTSFCNCCLASNINLVLLGTYIIAKDPDFDPFCVWGNEIFMNQHQVRKLIRIVRKKDERCKNLFVYTLIRLQRIYNFLLFHAIILPFWMNMGFTLHFYIIFGTNLLTGGPAHIAVFLPISVFRRKGISNGDQTE